MQKNSVAIVGVLNDESSTNVWMAAAFTRAGWSVFPINYRTLGEDFGEYYRFIINRFNPKLTILSKINGVDPSIIASAKDTLTWYWFMDNINVAEAIHAEEFVKIVDYASATSGEVVDEFRKVNPKSYYIIEGYEPKIFYETETEKDIDVLFFGNATAKRIEFLSKLERKPEIYGVGWPKEFHAKQLIYLDDLREVIARSKIILNLVHANIFSDRVITTMACGGFVLSEYCKDLFTFFKNEENIVWFRDVKEYNKLMDYYLNNEEAREKIAKNGRKISENYTWDIVIQRIMRIAGV